MAEYKQDLALMAKALGQARLAGKESEVPIGAVVYHKETDTVVGLGRNSRESHQDPMGHAEIQAISQAAKSLKNWRLEGCTLYVTLEPCLMCAGAIFQARMDRVVFGAYDPKAGVFGSLYDFSGEDRFNHSVEITAGVGAQEAETLLKNFFSALRAKFHQI